MSDGSISWKCFDCNVSGADRNGIGMHAHSATTAHIETTRAILRVDAAETAERLRAFELEHPETK